MYFIILFDIFFHLQAHRKVAYPNTSVDSIVYITELQLHNEDSAMGNAMETSSTHAALGSHERWYDIILFSLT